MFVSKKRNYESTPAFVSSAHIISRTRTATQAMGTDVDGKKVLKAGSVFPANDATAEGLTLHDVDLTHGDQPVGVMVEGYVYEARLPVAVDTLAKPELKEIKFEKYNVTEEV